MFKILINQILNNNKVNIGKFNQVLMIIINMSNNKIYNILKIIILILILISIININININVKIIILTNTITIIIKKIIIIIKIIKLLKIIKKYN